MSKSIFANSTNAVGFAGVILVVAVVAVFAASAFMPSLQDGQEPVVEEVTETAPPKPAPTQAVASWAEDDFGNDWGDDETSGPAAADATSGDNNGEIDEPGFGDYAPAVDRGGSRRASGGTSTRTSVRSGAAPGAPKLEAPSNGDSAPPGKLAIES